MSERLQKRLARAGIASRRAAEDLIRAGRVTVNGQAATLGDRVTDADDVRVDGQLLVLDPVERVTLALYKPRGIVTSAHDELGRAGVLDLMPRIPGLHTVGRLDRDSEGLLLLTTDGNLTLRLTHPRYAHEKVYRAWVSGDLGARDLETLASGVDLEGDHGETVRTAPAEIERADGGLYITIREGRNRQVRRMLGAVGAYVTRLVRVRFGGVFLGDLQPGEYRTLTERDLTELEDPAAVPRPEWQRLTEGTRERWG